MDMNSPNSADEANGEVAVPFMMDVRSLSPEQFAQLGMAKLAYVKPVIVQGTAGFAIHAADGTPMAIAADRDVAFAAIMQHEMAPVLVH